MDRSQARNGHSEEDELHDRGLAFDVRTLIERRHALKLLGRRKSRSSLKTRVRLSK